MSLQRVMPSIEIATVAPKPAGSVAIGRGEALTIRKRKGQDMTPHSKGPLGHPEPGDPRARVREAEALLSGGNGRKNLRTGRKAGSHYRLLQPRSARLASVPPRWAVPRQTLLHLHEE